MTCGFAVHPDNCEAFCVGYTDGLVYATTNGGENWFQLKVEESKLYGLRLVATA
jgi:photosystem II stability/assembly factor-like uncharacterized protein